MARTMDSSTRRPRLSIDVGPDFRWRVRLAAARRDLTVRQYVLEALEDRLRQDLADGTQEALALTATVDPVLAELWDNQRDAEYDRLAPR